MRENTIFTDSCSDIPTIVSISDKENLEGLNEIKILPLYYRFHNENCEYGDENKLSMEEFFKRIKAGAIPTTSAVNPGKALELFEIELKKEKDIICICMSSELSMTRNSFLLAAQQLQPDYPHLKITVVDSLTASLAEGMMVMKALEMSKTGYSHKDIVLNIKKNKYEYDINFFVDDLWPLQRSGRIRFSDAMMGGILKLKPLIHINNFGKVETIEKIKGRKKRIPTLLNRMKAQGIDINEYIGILHSDNLELAYELRDRLYEMNKEYKTIIGEIGPVLGSHIGPGGIALTYKLESGSRR